MTNTTDNLTRLVDELGTIRAKMADLKARESEIRDAFLDAGVHALEGNRFRATVVEQMRTMVDWKAVAEKLQPSRQLVTAHTKHKEVTSIRVSARRGAIS